MKVKIHNTPESLRLLFKANVPSFVIAGIKGKVIDADKNLNVQFDWLEQKTEWNIPAECVEIVERDKPI